MPSHEFEGPCPIRRFLIHRDTEKRRTASRYWRCFKFFPDFCVLLSGSPCCARLKGCQRTLPITNSPRSLIMSRFSFGLLLVVALTLLAGTALPNFNEDATMGMVVSKSTKMI